MVKKIWVGLLAAFAVVLMACTSAFAQQTSPPPQQQTKPNILFIMGDDIGWMQPSIYHRGLMVGETPNIDRIGKEGAMFVDYGRHAELHLGTQCLLHRHVSLAHRHDPAATPRLSSPMMKRMLGFELCWADAGQLVGIAIATPASRADHHLAPFTFTAASFTYEVAPGVYERL